MTSLNFGRLSRGRLDQGLVSFQHRLRPSGAVFFQRYWKSLPVLFYGAHAYVEKLVQPQATQWRHRDSAKGRLQLASAR